MYFDHAATSPPSEELNNKLPELSRLAAFNPSSSHRGGLEVRRRLDLVREKMARAIGADPEEIYFTSGASEANSLILQGIDRLEGSHIISSGVEHDSVENTLKFLETRGLEVTRLSPDKLVNKAEIVSKIKNNTVLVSLIKVQNETGQIFELEGLGEELRARKILYHRDMVQALGKVPVNVKSEGIDFASFSSHKIGGIKGLGVLYKRKDKVLKPLIFGGEQEAGLRPGTENTLGILTLGEVLESLNKEDYTKALYKNQLLRKGIVELGGRIISPEDSSAYILAASFKFPSEVLLTALSSKGVYASAGSACHARSKKKARVTRYLDEDLARGMIRFSISPSTSKGAIKGMLDLLKDVLKELERYI